MLCDPNYSCDPSSKSRSLQKTVRSVAKIFHRQELKGNKYVRSAESTDIYPIAARYIAQRRGEFDDISEGRKQSLEAVADYVRGCIKANKIAQLTFICTHNSRRSQLSQVWARIAADVFNLNVETFSGGTETTAFNPRAVECLRRAGLKIEAENAESSNPIYRVRHGISGHVQTCFSKIYKEPPNPASEYCAVMTCSHADEACPLVIGCQHRVPVMYEDPKAADDTPEESAVYDKRSRQICREMFYMMSMVNT